MSTPSLTVGLPPRVRSCANLGFSDLSRRLSLDSNWFIVVDKLTLLDNVGFPARAWLE